ncbi:DUF61 family protein [Acidianus sulfidivorans JP7]|uniref:DUF61 domain-containing protein n=1 Tax=Acidianus sulfidivorans JP7 TaxID=619593 RepID=A0A2U9IP28_9CREN|nr:DUF61 family protein [Acidianus sulfidivorans]AWR97798.1 DUF61 family protein [Acidianus sulfidivorans JP7]
MLDKIIELGLKDILSGLPSERVTLKDALSGHLKIRLNNGTFHNLDEREVKDFSSKIPLYLWSLVKIPIIITKSFEVGEYDILESEWDKKALGYVLGRDFLYLTTVDVEELLRSYKTLIFITLSSSNIFLTTEKFDEGV